MAEFTIERCRSCNAEIIWATSASTLKAMPIDAEPTQNGNIQLRVPVTGGAPTAYVLNTAAQFGKTDLRTSHFATCEHAAQWRKRRAKTS